jgi:hypothetical protein
MMYVAERKQAYEKLRTYKKKMESGEIEKEMRTADANSKAEDIIIIDDATENSETESSPTIRSLPGQSPSPLGEGLLLKLETGQNIKKEPKDEEEPVAKRHKSNTSCKVSAPRQAADTDKANEQDDDEIARLEDEAAQLEKELQEAEAIPDLRRRSAAAKSQLKAARARKGVEILS